MQHIDWAYDQNQLSEIAEYLFSLTENEWYYSGHVIVHKY